jgi:hypothetical protein
LADCFYFSFSHMPMISRVTGRYRSIRISYYCYNGDGVVTTFSSFRSSDLSQSI